MSAQREGFPSPGVAQGAFQPPWDSGHVTPGDLVAFRNRNQRWWSEDGVFFGGPNLNEARGPVSNRLPTLFEILEHQGATEPGDLN